MITIRKKCPACSQITGIRITEDVALKYYESTMGNGNIDDLRTSKSNRKFLKTGLCPSCEVMATRILARYA